VQEDDSATTALVLGILGIVVCGLIALSIGHSSVKRIDASGGRLGGRSRAQAGFICGLIGTILLVLEILFGALAVFGSVAVGG
jgi:hypothetical protein